ncbi:MAG: SurA N-terminal domain-containing protein [Pseudomonadota bacterium]
MLLTIRKQASTLIAKIMLFGVLIVAFGIWGIADVFTPDHGHEAVIRVGDREISLPQLQNHLQNDVARYRQQGLSANQARDPALLDISVDRLVGEVLLDHEAGRLWLDVDPATVRQISAREESFQDETGAFDVERFRGALFGAGLSEEAYINLMRRAITRNWVEESLARVVVGDDDYVVPYHRSIAGFLTRWRGETREGQAVRISWADQEVPETLDEGEIRAHFEANLEAFRVDEFRTLHVALISPEQLTGEISLDEDEILDVYESRLDEFSRPEQRDLEQFLLQDEGQARRVQDLLLEGASLAQITEQIGEQAIDYRRFDNLDLADIPDPAILQALDGLVEEGAVSDVVESLFGPVILRVVNYSPAQVIAFERVRSGLENELKLEIASDLAFEMSGELVDAIAGGATVQEAGRNLGLFTRTMRVDARGFLENGTLALAEFSNRGQLFEEAFTLSEGTETDLVAGDDGFYAIASINDIMPSHIPDFNDAIPQARQSWRQELQRQAARAQAAMLMQTIEESGEEPDAETMLGVGDLVYLGPVTRRNASVGGGNAAERALFEMREGETRLVDDQNATILVMLDTVEPAGQSSGAGTDHRDGTVGEYADALAAAVREDLLRLLHDRYEVGIDRTLLGELYEGFAAGGGTLLR